MFFYQNLCLTLVLFLSVELHIASSDTFYIVTSSDSPCPGEFTGVPCLTLQDYASNPSRSANNIITLIVEPGAYNLSTVLTVSNGYNFTISSTNTTVLCTTTNARFTFDAVENVHISGMAFQGCSNPLQITGGQKAQISKMEFESCSGAAIQITHGEMVQISEVEVESCSGTAVQIMDGEIVKISETVVQRSGTGIQMTRVVNAILTNSSFSNNGRAIYASTLNNFTIAMSNFSNNGRTYGGAISARMVNNLTIDMSNFSNNRASSYGGAIYVSNSGSWSGRESLNLRVSGSVFTSNTVSGYNGQRRGGAIYIEKQGGSSVVTIERSVFTYNSVRSITYYNYNPNSQYEGGAVYVSNFQCVSSTITIDRTIMSYNYVHVRIYRFGVSLKGGGIFISNRNGVGSSTILIDRSVFNNNAVRATSCRNCYHFLSDNHNGGAISIFDQQGSGHELLNITINSSEFRSNIAVNVNPHDGTSGGAINIKVPYSYQLATTISNSSFNHNIADRFGGALYMRAQRSGGAEGNTNNPVTLTVNSFVNNRVRRGYGGAIYSLGNNERILIHQNIYHDNTAFYSGGALFVSGINSSVNVTNSSFISNRCTTSAYGWYGGGAIYKSGNNGGILTNQNQFQNNRAHTGGALYAVGHNSLVNATDNSFTNNIAITGSGGAIYKSGNIGDVQSQQNHFYNNIAGQNGGAIFKHGNAGDILSQRNDFHNNTAITGSGGAIYKSGNNGTVLLEQNYYYNNTANTFGGAVYGTGTNSLINVTRTSFIKNMATLEGGGAIYIDGLYVNVTLSSSIFNHNSASYCGVLDVDNYAPEQFVNLINSVFTYNYAATTTTATTGGGVACIRNASINIINSTFRHNVAENHAGVLFTDESVTVIDRSSFINNTAALDGGVFYTYVHASDYVITRSQFSENSAGDDGGVIFIGCLNSFVFIDESLFDFNSADYRGGVIAIYNASTLHIEINRTNIFNNSAQYGGVISACNSQITFIGESLNVTVDPVLSFCMLYGGDINEFNITLPPDPVIPTQPPITTELATTESETTQPETVMQTATEQVSTQDAFTTEAESITVYSKEGGQNTSIITGVGAVLILALLSVGAILIAIRVYKKRVCLTKQPQNIYDEPNFQTPNIEALKMETYPAYGVSSVKES